MNRTNLCRARRFATVFTILGTLSMMTPAHALVDSHAEIKAPRPLTNVGDVKTPAPLTEPVKPHTIVDAETFPPQRDLARPNAKPAFPAQLAAAFQQTNDQLVWDVAADGTIWVRGSNYKAAFNADGVTFIPFTGSHAPCNERTHYALAQAQIARNDLPLAVPAQATRAGQRVSIDRGPVIEIYDVRSDGIEQSFVLNELPDVGDITLRIAVDSNMTRSVSDNELSLKSSRGEVKYSSAVAIDADGRRIAAPTMYRNGDILIVVPASFASDARVPLVVDPFISAFSAESGTPDSRVSDVAYDATTQRYFVTWEQSFSETDGDIFADTFDANGISLGTLSIIDITEDNWRNPSCANNNIANAFLVVAEVGFAPTRIINSRTRAASSAAVGPVIAISGSESGDKHNPAVGGDPHTLAPTFYCVAYQRDYSASDTDILARLVSSSGVPQGISFIPISNSVATLDTNPSISKSDGAPPSDGQAWSIVWERDYFVGDSDIFGAQVAWDGAILHAAFPVDITDAVHHHPSVSTVLDSPTGGPRPYMVAYEELTASFNYDIAASVLEGATSLTSTNLSQLQVVRRQQNQITPAVDADGLHFIVAHNEMFDADPNDYDVIISSFCLQNDSLVAAENRRVMGGLLAMEDSPAIASVHSAGGSGATMICSWRLQSALGNGNIAGGFYQSRAACGCTADVAATFGVVDVADLLLVINYWGTNIPNVNADINGDQKVDVADLLQVITHWGACPGISPPI